MQNHFLLLTVSYHYDVGDLFRNKAAQNTVPKVNIIGSKAQIVIKTEQKLSVISNTIQGKRRCQI